MYQWKRFWHPRGEQPCLDGSGFLFDPESEVGRDVSPRTRSFDSLAPASCLALLGEPGSGKSIALQADLSAVETGRSFDDLVLFKDLSSYGSEDRLIQDVFCGETFDLWREGGGRLHLFLDSLDECLLRIEHVAALLADQLQGLPHERLRLRVASRTAEWPPLLDRVLASIWGEEGFQAYELAPLRRRDVEQAADANGIDAADFLAAVAERGAAALASKPITLAFLVNLYKARGELPSSQAELYLEGCRLLCTETSESRRSARRHGRLSTDTRLSLASRIAALTVFGNRSVIRTDTPLGDLGPEEIALRDLCGGSEAAGSIEVEATDQAIMEVLGTGLFRSRGTERLGWTHQTYAEFLAAHYITSHQVTARQTMSLLTHAGDPCCKLVPQLHETAAWLAGSSSDVFAALMVANPEILLRSDVASADSELRARLVGALLARYDSGDLLDRDWGLRAAYRNLQHPALGAQLHPYITDPAKGNVVRRVAIDIAEACKLDELQGPLADLALDASQRLADRVNAAYAVARIGDQATKSRLRPLANGTPEDEEDELKGCALSALWPEGLTADELFPLLIRPKRESFFGSYVAFLLHEVVKRLRPEDLGPALRWVSEREEDQFDIDPLERIADTVMELALCHLRGAGVIDLFVDAAIARLTGRHHAIVRSAEAASRFEADWKTETEKRREILTRLVMLVPGTELHWVWLRGAPRAESEDMGWLLEQIIGSPIERRDRWLELTERIFRIDDRDHLRAVLQAWLRSRELAAAFPYWLLWFALHVPPLYRLYSWWCRWRAGVPDQSPKRPALKPPPAERISRLLEGFEGGRFSAWWHLNMELTLRPDSTHYGDELRPDLTTLPGWAAADVPTRARIIAAAERYLLEADPQTAEWLGTNTLHRPAFAGYRALRLLQSELPEALESLPASSWERWSPITLGYPTADGIDQQEPVRGLVDLAYQHAPARIVETLVVLIDQENAQLNHLFVTRKLGEQWDTRLCAALLARIRGSPLKPAFIGEILKGLLRNCAAGARAHAESLLASADSSAEARSIAVQAAAAMLGNMPDAGWEVVWPLIRDDTAFGRQLAEDLAGHGGAAFVTRLREDQVADLYLWAAREFPHNADPDEEGAHFVTPRESARWWRDSLLAHLQGRGTFAACQAIERIMVAFPTMPHLKWVLAAAQDQARRSTWASPRPEAILQLARDRRARFVESGEQLLDLLAESLAELDVSLQAETPAVANLWNDPTVERAKVYTPKDEEHLSDYVKNHLVQTLQRRGVVVNREVQIRRTREKDTMPGERLDIVVDAVSPESIVGATHTITVTIEVKGCWNRELRTAMETQLVARYLNDTRCKHGIYLVGWYNCDQWDDSDYKKADAPDMTLETARAAFDAQAVSLSKDGVVVRAFVLDAAIR